MSYALGVDIGTSFVTTAIARPGHGDVDTPSVHGAARSPSALFQDAAGVVHHGEAAERRGRSEPERLVRAVTDRVGDDVPIAIGDRRHTAEGLYASIAREVVDRIAAGEGSAPSAIRFVLPVRWGPHRTGLVREALAEVGISGASFTAGPAAAMAATGGLDQPDAAVAVYDLSASRFTVTVRRGAGVSPLAVDGVENLGGGDVDDAIVRHVVASAHELFGELDSGDPDAVDALRQLRGDCARAKESLTRVTETFIPVRLPSGAVDAVLDRAALDRIAEPVVRATVAVFRRAMRSARIDAGELAAIVLVGGSARLAVVTRILSEEFGRPVMTSDMPEATAACGGALEALAMIDSGASATREEADDDAPRHPTLLTRIRRGAVIGSSVIRRGTGAVAAATAAVVAMQPTADGSRSIESDAAGSAG